MRTTLDIDDDVLVTARGVARRERKTLGQVVSDLARRTLQAKGSEQIALHDGQSIASDELSKRLKKLGVIPYEPPDGKLVTNDVINALRDRDGI